LKNQSKATANASSAKAAAPAKKPKAGDPPEELNIHFLMDDMKKDII